MDFSAFQKSIDSNTPPDGISPYLLALWYDAKGNWNKAHEIVQDIEDQKAYWIHAYLHRREGDIGNSGYWYNKAGKTRPEYSLEEEWKAIASGLAS